MKIAIVSHYFESHRGGVEIVAGGLARAFARCGHAVIWLACDVTPPPEAGTFAVVVLPAVNPLENRFGLPIPIPKPAGIARIFRHVRRADAVVVHDALYPTSALAFLAARMWRKPLVIAAHIGTIPYRNPLARQAIGLANNVLARPLLAHADRVAFVSEITAGYFATVRFRAPPVTIFNGIDTDIFRPAADPAARAAIRDRLGLPLDRRMVLFAGRFVEKKGLHIIATMARRRPEILWVLAGWGTVDPERWGLANIRVFSKLSGASLAPLYQASDAFVLPSVGEGYPLVIQEALACGLPVVCGEETARADPAAQPFLTPVAMDHDDPHAIAAEFCAAIDRILADPSGREAAAAARSRFAAERYSWDCCAAKYLALIASAGRPMPSARRDPEVSESNGAEKIEFPQMIKCDDRRA